MYAYYIFYKLNGRNLVESFDDYTTVNGVMALLKNIGATDIEFVCRRDIR